LVKVEYVWFLRKQEWQLEKEGGCTLHISTVSSFGMASASIVTLMVAFIREVGGAILNNQIGAISFFFFAYRREAGSVLL
jgi:hypothetical protein